MIKILENIGGDIRSTAKVVDGALILSLPDAISPVVWRWNLGEAKASALEVREAGNGNYKLVLKTPRGDVQDVAPFENKAKAMNALMAVSHAMENAQGQIQGVSNDGGGAPIISQNAKPQKSDGMKLMTGIGAVALIIVLFTWLGSIVPKRMDTNAAALNTTATPAASSGTSGVPMSAEDYLSGR